MIPGAFHFSDEYANLKMPVVIVAGDEDLLVDIDAQSSRLHSDIPQSKFHRVPETGHMVHQTATGVVMSAINEVAGDTSTADKSPSRPSPGQSPKLGLHENVPLSRRAIE